MVVARTGFASLLIFFAVACDERPREPSAETRDERIVAYRVSCISRELALEADDNLMTLEALAGVTAVPGDTTNPLASGAVVFAQAYQRHAEMRSMVYAYLDSAVNHAPTPEDSARYVERAERFTIRAPSEGTVEANVMNNFDANLAGRLQNADHRCNWDIPF